MHAASLDSCAEVASGVVMDNVSHRGGILSSTDHESEFNLASSTNTTSNMGTCVGDSSQLLDLHCSKDDGGDKSIPFALAFDSGKPSKHVAPLPVTPSLNVESRVVDNSFLLDLPRFEPDDGDKLSFLKQALERGEPFDDGTSLPKDVQEAAESTGDAHVHLRTRVGGSDRNLENKKGQQALPTASTSGHSPIACSEI